MPVNLLFVRGCIGKMISYWNRSLSLDKAMKMIRRYSGLSTFSLRCAVTKMYSLRLKLQTGQDIAGLDLRRKGTHGFEGRVARDDDLRRVDSLAKQVLAMVLIVWQQDVTDVVDQDAIALFRHPPVPGAQSCLHVEDLDAPMSRGKHGQSAVCVAQHQQCFRPHLLHQFFRFQNDVGDFLSVAGSVDIQIRNLAGADEGR